MKLLKGTTELHELDYEDFAYKYITQNRRGYNMTSIIYEDNVFKMSAPKFESGYHSTIYTAVYGDDVERVVESLLDLQEEMLLQQEKILREEILEQVKSKLTVDIIFKEESQ